jgi:thiol-disulfide isomerase/thioredoxin
MPMPDRKGFGVILAAVVATAAGFYIGVSRLEDPSAEAESLLAKTVFTDLQNRPAQIGQWAGRPRILNFWATWCAPCREEMPLLDRFQAAHAGDVQVVAIALDEPLKVANFVDHAGIKLPILLGNAETFSLMRALGNQAGGLPFTVYLDAKGGVRGRQLGPVTEERLLKALGELQDMPVKSANAPL